MADTNITMTTAGGVRLETEGNYVDTDIVVAPDSTSQANLIPENIRSGVSILDVDGTLNPQDGLSMYTTTATLVTTGTGTIAATAINLPTGRTLQVDDLLVDTAGTVVRVTAVGTNVSYSYYASYRGPAGQGVPSGGTTGQVLKKASNTNYDTEWADESGGGGGSGDDYVLIEFSSNTPSETEQQQAYQTVMTAYNAGNNLTNLWISVTSSGIENKSHLSVIYESEAPLFAIGFQALSMGQNNTTFAIIQINFSNNAGSLNVVSYDISGFVYANSPAFTGTPTAPTPTDSSGATQIATKGYVDSKAGIQSNTASQSAFSTVSNIVTTTDDSPDASALPENTLVIKIAS